MYIIKFFCVLDLFGMDNVRQEEDWVDLSDDSESTIEANKDIGVDNNEENKDDADDYFKNLINLTPGDNEDDDSADERKMGIPSKLQDRRRHVVDGNRGGGGRLCRTTVAQSCWGAR